MNFSKVTNAELQRRSTSLAKGFVSKGGIAPGESNVLMILNDSVEWLITDLALSKIMVPSFTISSLEFLAPVLEHYPPSAIVCHVDLVPQLLELIADSNESSHHKLFVVGRNSEAEAHLTAQASLQKHSWEDLELTGAGIDMDLPTPKPSNTVTIGFYSVSNGVPQGTRLTHENVVAGVTATRVLPPLSDLLTPADSVFSAYSPSTPLGRAILYSALFEGAHFTTTQSTILDPPYNLRTPRDASDLVGTTNSNKVPPPTVFFGDASHVESLTRDILNEAKSSTAFFDLACRHKFKDLEEGYSTNASFWDKFLLKSARKLALGKGATTLRLVIIADPVIDAGLLPMQVALSIPLVRILSHPNVCGPICASHGLDLQYFPEKRNSSSSAHVGPPSVNIEAKLTNVNESEFEKGADPVGELLIRGPSIGNAVPSNDVADEEISEYRWVAMHQRASIRSNGTFTVIDS